MTCRPQVATNNGRSSWTKCTFPSELVAAEADSLSIARFCSHTLVSLFASRFDGTTLTLHIDMAVYIRYILPLPRGRRSGTSLRRGDGLDVPVVPLRRDTSVLVAEVRGLSHAAEEPDFDDAREELDAPEDLHASVAYFVNIPSSG